MRDLVLSSKPSMGFPMLIDRNMAALTFEHVALQHPDRFDSNVLDAASAQLQLARVETLDDAHRRALPRVIAAVFPRCL